MIPANPVAIDPVAMDEKPTKFIALKSTGTLKPIVNVILDRRATSHFSSEKVAPEALEAILRLGAQAPSGYNLQPWRFIVVQDPEGKKLLQAAAFDQVKISEAPVVIIALGLRSSWKETMEEVLSESARRGASDPNTIEQTKNGALKFLSGIPSDLWANRHTMIAFTTMMLVAESFGYDTAPMEGFDPVQVRKAFGIPEDAEVVALLAIGKAKGKDKPYPGRLPLEQTVYSERFGSPWENTPSH